MSMLAGILALTFLAQAAPTSPALTREEMATFLKTAKVVHAKPIGKGITSPVRLTLTDGRITHDAAFQAVDEHRATQEFATGGRELNFIDSWRYDVAATRLAELVGLGEMMPVTVERRWRGDVGALSWWIDTMMDEKERLDQKKDVPNPEDWNQQMLRLRVFSQLVSDSDRNLTNVLITPEWQIRMIDFTRGFRLWPTIKEHEITRCDRRLLAALEGLTLDSLLQATQKYLSKDEAKAVIARRDLIVAHVRKLIAEKGENAILY